MRGIVIAFLLLALAAFAFVFGLISQQVGFTMGSFCLSPLLLIGFGWALRGAFGGKRLTFVESDTPRATRLGNGNPNLERAREKARRLQAEDGT